MPCRAGGEKIHETISGWPKITNTAARRQRRGMQQECQRRGEKDMERSLHSRLAAAAAQRLDLFFVALDLPRFRHLVDEIGDEKDRSVLLFTLSKIANLIALGGKIRLGRLLAFRQLEHSCSRCRC